MKRLLEFTYKVGLSPWPLICELIIKLLELLTGIKLSQQLSWLLSWLYRSSCSLLLPLNPIDTFYYSF